MRRLVQVLLLIALLFPSIFPIAVASQEATPQTIGSPPGHPLVGSWIMDPEPEDDANGPRLIVFSSDGTVIQGWDEATAAGAWQATGERTALATFIRIMETEEFTGTATFRAALTVDQSGSGFTGEYTVSATSPDGSEAGTTSGTLSGARIMAESPERVDGPHAAIPIWFPIDETAAPAEATPPASADGNALAGTAPETLPPGETGEVSVVLAGAPNDIPLVVFILRNNTDGDVRNVEVAGVVRGPDGAVIAELSPPGFITPYRMAPGSLAIGYHVIYGIDDVPAGTTFDLEVAYDLSSDINHYGSTDVTLSDVKLTDDGISGVASNSLDEPVSIGILVGVCFDAEGSMIGMFDGLMDVDIPAAESAPFSGDFLYPGKADGVEMKPTKVCASYIYSILASLS